MARDLRKTGSLPITVGILLLIGGIYAAIQVFQSLFAIPIVFDLEDESVFHTLLGSLLSDLPWTCVIIAGVIGLWRRRVWAWSIYLIVSGWLCAASLPVIYISPDFEVLAFVVFIVLFTRKVRLWCRVDFQNAIRWILVYTTFFLGWLWCSLLLPDSHLPPDLLEIKFFLVICAIVCWLGLWIASYVIAEQKKWAIMAGCIVAVMAATILVSSFVGGWFGLQQRLLWAFSTIYGRASLWIAVEDYMGLLGIVLICANVAVIFLLWSFRKVLITRHVETQDVQKPPPGKLLEGEGKREMGAKRTSADVILGLMALGVVVLHILDLIAMGFGVGGCFIFYGFMAMVVLVPLAVFFMLVRTALWWQKLENKQRIFRTVLILSLVLISLIFILSPGFLMNFWLTDIGMRLKIASTGGAEQLQAWAVDILEKPQNEVVDGDSMSRIKEEALSKQVRRLYPAYVFVASTSEENGPHIRIIWGGGFHHWGILVGPPTFHTVSNEGQCVYRWRDGVYGYHEIQ